MDASERRTRAATEAAEWWLHVQPDTMPETERQKFVAWLRESPIHVEELLRVARVYRELAHFDDWQNVSTEGAAEETLVEFPSGHPSFPSLHAAPRLEERAISPEGSEGGGRQRWTWALAATVAAIAITTPWLWPQFAGQTIATERAERRELALSDGSKLQVDPETRLRVRYDEHSRRIELQQGRALFKVAKDPNRPFTVQAYDTLIRAVGTSFAVERKAQGVTVTVAEGKVAVSSPATSENPSHGEKIIAAPPILAANEQMTVKRSGRAEPVRKVDPQRELAWTEGRLVFDKSTVAAAVEQFNRYNPFRLEVKDPELAARTVSGIFDASDPESFVSFLQAVEGISVDRSQGPDIALASR